ncbi:MAG TPA: hypothetical protein VIS10_13230 [Anaerolineales bacterium]
MAKDRFLLIILLIIVALAALAVVLFFVRQGSQDYGSDISPQGVVRNYVLALEKKDFARAYGYLREGAGKPDFERFRQDFIGRELDISSVGVQIGETQPSGKDILVSVVVIRSGGGPFGDVYRESNSALLVLDETGSWKLASMPYPYWGWDWYNPQLQRSVPAVPGD